MNRDQLIRVPGRQSLSEFPLVDRASYSCILIPPHLPLSAAGMSSLYSVVVGIRDLFSFLNPDSRSV